MRDRIAVVSPHLDDAVLSLGSAMSAWTRSGAEVSVITVFSGSTSSDAPAGGWDLRAGFASEGEAARARRVEDGEACMLVGAVPTWLPFGDMQYERHGTEEQIVSAVRDAVAGADLVLIPGCPATHPDHRWLTLTLLEHGLAGGLYVEQPYLLGTRIPRARAVVPAQIRSRMTATPRWDRVHVSDVDRQAKRRAIAAYVSQVPLLGEARLRKRLPRYEWMVGGERIADPARHAHATIKGRA